MQEGADDSKVKGSTVFPLILQGVKGRLRNRQRGRMLEQNGAGISPIRGSAVIPGIAPMAPGDSPCAGSSPGLARTRTLAQTFAERVFLTLSRHSGGRGKFARSVFTPAWAGCSKYPERTRNLRGEPAPREKRNRECGVIGSRGPQHGPAPPLRLSTTEWALYRLALTATDAPMSRTRSGTSTGQAHPAHRGPGSEAGAWAMGSNRCKLVLVIT